MFLCEFTFYDKSSLFTYADPKDDFISMNLSFQYLQVYQKHYTHVDIIERNIIIVSKTQIEFDVLAMTYMHP